MTYPRRMITKTAFTPSGPSPTGSAPGIWRLDEVAYWIKQGVWPDATADQYWPYNALLLSTTSLSNANNNLFVDSSGAFNPISRNGNTTQGSFTPYGSNWSNYFDGSGDYLTSSTAIGDFGTGDFTVEYWAFNNKTQGSNFAPQVGTLADASPSNTWRFGTFSATGYLVFAYHNGSTFVDQTFNAVNYNDGVWHHYAICRSGSTLRAFVDGIQIGSNVTVTQNLTSGKALQVGREGYTPTYYTGNISNLRICKATALYTSNFTPSTTPLTAITGTTFLSCQSNRFIDNSSNGYAITAFGNTAVQKFSPYTLAAPGISYNQSDITNWSGYFDGTGDYLYYGASSAFAFGTGSFTVEFFVYTTSTASQMVYDTIQPGISGGGSTRFYVYINTSQQLVVGPFPSQLTTTGTISLGAWNHVAIVRNGTTRTVYINGVSAASDTFSGDLTSGYATVGFDAASGGTIILNGYLSNLRAVKGTAVYTSGFTPPTTNLTAISGTSLLTCQNAAFTDNSTNNFVVTINGNTTVTGNSPFNTVGYWSNYFNGTNAYLTSATSSAYAMGTGDFTIEGWFFTTASGDQALWDNRASTSSAVGIGCRLITSTNTLRVILNNTALFTTSQAVTLNQWNHIAIVRASGTVTAYLNGTAMTGGSATGTTNITDTNMWIGKLQDAGFFYNGYISNFRVVKGTAVYTTTFTPPTTPLTAISGTSLLTCQNGRFIDNSTNNFTLTATGTPQAQSFDPFYTATIASNGGSMYFDGSGDYLTVQSAPNMNFGTGNWTVECWVYVSTRTTNYPLIFGNNNGAFTSRALALTASNSDSASFNDRFVLAWGAGAWISPSFGNSSLLVANATNSNNAWYHLAVVRESSTSVKMYRNGVQVANAEILSTRTFDWGSSIVGGSLLGGGNWDGAQGAFNGYISNLRATPSAVYTAAFTPPTSVLTPSASTTLLVNGMNAGAYDATAINDMETVGNAQVSTVQSKFGGSSVYFDGTGDNLICNPSTPNVFAFGSGDFTIEFWAYMNSVSGIQVFYDGRPASVQGLYPTIYISGTQVRYFTSSADRITGGTVATGTWYHIAVSRSGTSTRMFLNGTQIGSTYTDTSAYTNTTNRPGIGFDANASTYYLNGYIDDLRVTAGVARYTTTFTPPTQAFPTY